MRVSPLVRDDRARALSFLDVKGVFARLERDVLPFHKISCEVVSSSEPESGKMGLGNPPEVTVDKTWIHAAPGLRSELVCRVMADPQARVEWVFQDRPVVTSSRVIALSINEKNTLLIRSVRASELGHYTCKASNMMGHSQQVVELSGEGFRN
ncbi:unnamed protein product [Timema podura]|uniref:Ig-like domain-containing protein n=1 Tax=Timema podura TaxID=61482 RepID=A0ABN7PK72_TIMPD|nr:unnamed protein product [Timema podura]